MNNINMGNLPNTGKTIIINSSGKYDELQKHNQEIIELKEIINNFNIFNKINENAPKK